MNCDCSPRLIGSSQSSVIAAERAPAAEMAVNDAFRIFWIEQDRMQNTSAGARLPTWPGAMLAQTNNSCHDLPPSVVLNSAASLNARVGRCRVGQRRLKMPDTLELPRCCVPSYH